jgi:hypothetical protein
VAAGLAFPHAAQTIRVTRRTRPLTGGRWRTATIYAVTNLAFGQATPAELASWIRGHWQIEALHHIRDVTYAEDAPQIRARNAPASWPPSGTWPSSCIAGPGIPTSPPPATTTPATPAAPWQPADSALYETDITPLCRGPGLYPRWSFKDHHARSGGNRAATAPGCWRPDGYAMPLCPGRSSAPQGRHPGQAVVPASPRSCAPCHPYTCGVRYKCPAPECPPTDFKPEEVTSMGDEVPQAVCGGDCGRTYPKDAFKKVP